MTRAAIKFPGLISSLAISNRIKWELITGVSPAGRTDGVLVLRSESAAPTCSYAVGLVECRCACPGNCRRTPRPAFTDLERS